MIEQHHPKNKGSYQSKFTLKKKNFNYLPQMAIPVLSTFNKSKDEISTYRQRGLENKKEMEAIPMTDLNVFIHQMNKKQTNIKSNGTNIGHFKLENKSKGENSRLLIKNYRAKSKENTKLVSFKDRAFAKYNYKTENNSLTKNGDQYTLNNEFNGLQKKGKNFPLVVSYINQVNNPKTSKNSQTQPSQLQKNRYAPTSFINCNYQPSNIFNKPKNNNIKFRNPLQPLQTLKVNLDSRKTLDLIIDDCDMVKQVKKKEKDKRNTDRNWNVKEICSPKQDKNEASNESKEVSDALEYDEVRDIIIYHDFSLINFQHNYLFDEDDYENYITKKKETYLQYFSSKKKEPSSKTSNSNSSSPNKSLTVKGSQSKTIPIVKLNI